MWTDDRKRLLPMVALVVALSACSSGGSPTRTPTRQPTSTPASAPTAALDQMAGVFEGNYSKDEIKARVDRILTLLGMDRTEANYRHIGDVLVALQNHNAEAGCPECHEMAILNEMIASFVPGLSITLEELAALSSTALVTGADPIEP